VKRPDTLHIGTQSSRVAPINTVPHTDAATGVDKDVEKIR